MHTNTSPTFFTSGGKAIVSIGDGASDARKVIQQTDGKLILVGGAFFAGNQDFGVVRLNADGSFDADFGVDGKALIPVGMFDDQAYSVIQQTDGRLVIAGSSFNGIDWDFSIIRLNVDGSIDSSFGSGGKSIIQIEGGDDNLQSLIQQSDGKFVLAGFSKNGLSTNASIVRINLDGTLDGEFGISGKVVIANSVASDIIQLTGENFKNHLVVVGGSKIFRLNSDGGIEVQQPIYHYLDGGYKTIPLKSTISSLIQVSVDRIIIAGGSRGEDLRNYLALQKLDLEILLPVYGFETGTSPTGVAIAGASATDVIKQSGSIIVARLAGDDFAITRIGESSGLPITSFGINGTKTISFGDNKDVPYSLLAQPDGKLVAVGTSSTPSNSSFSIVRLNNNGTFDNSFNPVHSIDQVASYVEGGVAVVLDSDVGIYDAELAVLNGGVGNYAGASLTLARASGSVAEDVFSANGALSLIDGNAVLSGVTIGTFTQTNGTLTLTFNGAATQVRINEALSSIAYNNTSDAPPVSVQIGWSFSDGNIDSQGTGGIGTASGITTVNITAVNDAPVISGIPTHIQNITMGTATALADFSVTDPDGAGVNLTVTLIPANGTLGNITDANTSLAGIQLIGSAVDINAAIAGATFTATALGSARIGVSVSDGIASPVARSYSLNAALPVNSTPTGTVTISGTATQGQILTATNTLADADGMGTVSYQWMADGANISGATNATLVLGQAQVGKAITVKASYTDAQGTAESQTSSATTQVANVNDAPTGSVTISGATAQGQTLTASNTLADLDGMGTVSYQWMADGSNISGATSNTHTLSAAEVGKAITVQARYTDALGTAESQTSSATAPVSELSADVLTLQGMAYHWKSHMLLGDVSVQALSEAAVNSSTELIDLREAQWDAPTQTLTVQVWANATAAAASLDLSASATNSSSATFTSALSGDWTQVSNAQSNTVNFGAYTAGAGSTGALHIGTLSVVLDDPSVGTTLNFSGLNVGEATADNLSLSLSAQTTQSPGTFELGGLVGGSYALSVTRDAIDSGNAITSADALAALKIGVGINPNTGLELSPFQVIAADVTQDGKVSSADALAILRMAVKLPGALPQEWFFVNESQDLWDEESASSALTRTNANWESGLDAVELSQSGTLNLVGGLKGDVNGSWVAPAGSVDLDTLDPNYFQLLGSQLNQPTDVWGV